MYKVLIVDDERMIREGMKKVIPWPQLEIEEVLTASSGFEALSKLEQEMPDIMITDISMTGMTGLELIERALDVSPELRILVLTGYDSFEYARECLRLQVQDFLLKPIDEAVLSDCVRKEVKYLKEQEQQREVDHMLLRTEGISAQMQLEKMMRALVHGKDKEQAVEVLESQFNLRKDSRIMIAVLAPRKDLGNARQDGVLRLRQMHNICISVIDAKGIGITFSDGEDGNILIALYPEKCGSESTGTISDLLGILKDEFSYAPKTAIGSEVTGFGNIDISYQEALYLLQSDKMDIHQILQTQSAVNRNHMFQEVYEELKQEMCANVSDYVYIMRVFDSFCMAAESYNLSEASMRKYCFELIADVYYSFVTAGGAAKAQSLENFMESLGGAAGGVSLELGRQYLHKLISSEEKDVHEIVAKAKRYINQNLAEDLSVANIAEMLYVSPNYFSMAFKKHCGVSPTHYRSGKRK